MAGTPHRARYTEFSMNIQTNPAKIEKTSAAFPAITEEPIRSNFLPEDRLRVLGSGLAEGEVGDLFGLTPFEFQARIRDSRNGFSKSTARPMPRRRRAKPSRRRRNGC
ncbi:hypothetical protein AJ88_07400 [Mesorhizobium amorphae CCBAU 01583]|nr:hypothetical protein AJ88_07400 [Mesorhizobium amorphae CCBAU 01583]